MDSPLILRNRNLSIDLREIRKIAESVKGKGGSKPVLYDGGGGLGEAFKTISVSGQPTLNAVQYDKETLTLVEGHGIGLTTDVETNSITITNTVKNWGSFWSTVTQTNAGTTAANVMTLNQTDSDSRGTSIVDGSKIKVETAGVYNFQFSAQFDKPDAGDDEAEIWFAKNGNNIPDSSTVISLHGNDGKSVPSWNYMLRMNANDYIQIYWYSSDIDMRILARPAQSNPTRPAIPSLIATIQQVAI